MKFGAFIQEARIEARLTLRSFCRILGLDPGNWSKVERGLLAPPKRKRELKKIAEVLKFKEGSEKWHELFDLASISFIPEDFLDDQSLIEKLPVFFRTLRGEKPAKKELLSLLNKIKKS